MVGNYGNELPVYGNRRPEQQQDEGDRPSISACRRFLNWTSDIINIMLTLMTRENFKRTVSFLMAVSTLCLLINLNLTTSNLGQISNPQTFWRNVRRVAKKTARIATEMPRYSPGGAENEEIHDNKSVLNLTLPWMSDRGEAAAEEASRVEIDTPAATQENEVGQEEENGSTLTVWDGGEEASTLADTASASSS